MNFSKADMVLSGITRMLDKEGASEEALSALMSELYENIVGKYQPLIRALPTLTEKAAGDITPIAVAVVKFMNVVAADQALQEQIYLGFKLKAERRALCVTTYVSAGFSREEAMSLTLADIANINENKKQLVRSSKK